MPIYEYDCPKCGRIEIIQKISAKALKECPTCAEKGRKSKIERAVSAAAFHLKGSGWYKTDYASSSGSAGKGKSGASEKSSGDSSGSSADSNKAASEGSSKESNDSSAAKSDSKTSTETKSAKPKACGSGCGCH